MQRAEFERLLSAILSAGSENMAEPEVMRKLCLILYDETIAKSEQGWLAREDLAKKLYGDDRSHHRESLRQAIYRTRKRLEHYWEQNPNAPCILIEDDRGHDVALRDPLTGRLSRAYRLKLLLGSEHDTAADQAYDDQKQSLHDTSSQKRSLIIPQVRWLPDQSPPGALLRADIDQPVPFHGRDDEIQDLISWCQAKDDIAVRLYTGPGGMGKTRLVIELCHRLQTLGWDAGFIVLSPKHDSQKADFPALSDSAPALIVVDYAETASSALEAFFFHILSIKRHENVRVVLLARAAGDWWVSLKSAGRGVGDLIAGRATVHRRLDPLAVNDETRQQSFRLAYTHFSARLDRSSLLDEEACVSVLSDDYYDRVLLLHMLALAAVQGVEVKGEDGVLDYILRREQRFWKVQSEAKGLPQTLHRGISQAMGALTLGGGAKTSQEALEVLQHVPLLQDQPVSVIREVGQLLHEIYPGSNWIEPVMPDLLGEHLVEKTLEGDMDQLLDLALR